MRRRRGELAFQEEWGDLAIYNAEVARGIVHIPEWDAKMATEQAKFNAECREFGCHDDAGDTPMTPDHPSRYARPEES